MGFTCIQLFRTATGLDSSLWLPCFIDNYWRVPSNKCHAVWKWLISHVSFSLLMLQFLSSALLYRHLWCKSLRGTLDQVTDISFSCAVCDELVLGIPHFAWWVGIAALLCIVLAALAPLVLPLHKLLSCEGAESSKVDAAKMSWLAIGEVGLKEKSVRFCRLGNCSDLFPFRWFNEAWLLHHGVWCCTHPQQVLGLSLCWYFWKGTIEEA